MMMLDDKISGATNCSGSKLHELAVGGEYAEMKSSIAVHYALGISSSATHLGIRHE